MTSLPTSSRTPVGRNNAQNPFFSLPTGLKNLRAGAEFLVAARAQASPSMDARAQSRSPRARSSAVSAVGYASHEASAGARLSRAGHGRPAQCHCAMLTSHPPTTISPQCRRLARQGAPNGPLTRKQAVAPVRRSVTAPLSPQRSSAPRRQWRRIGQVPPQQARLSPKEGTRDHAQSRPVAYAKVPSAIPARRPRSCCPGCCGWNVAEGFVRYAVEPASSIVVPEVEASG